MRVNLLHEVLCEVSMDCWAKDVNSFYMNRSFRIYYDGTLRQPAGFSSICSGESHDAHLEEFLNSGQGTGGCLTELYISSGYLTTMETRASVNIYQENNVTSTHCLTEIYGSSESESNGFKWTLLPYETERQSRVRATQLHATASIIFQGGICDHEKRESAPIVKNI